MNADRLNSMPNIQIDFSFADIKTKIRSDKNISNILVVIKMINLR